jgi:hypothetical protein
MIIANVVYEHAVTLYIAVQSLGLLVLCGFVAFPVLARNAEVVPQNSDSDATVGSVSRLRS